MKYYYLGCLICTLIVLSGCSGQQQTRTVSEADRVVKIEVQPVATAIGVSSLHYSGMTEPLQTISLSFENVGTVEKVFVQEGDAVKKGQLLATLNKSDDEHLQNATQAKYKQAKDAYNRFKSVYKSGSLAEIKWVEIETTLKEAESQMQLARSSVEKCSLRAPVNGIVGKRDIEPGQYSLSLKSPIEIVIIKTILVKISVTENEISKIKKGQKATFSIAALDGKTFGGVVSNVGVVADPLSLTYDVKIMVPNNDLEIKPGMVCDVYLNTGMKQNYFTVSKDAVSKDSDGKAYVYVVSSKKKRAMKQEVRLGNYRDNGIEVISGLKPDQLVVTKGKEKLSNNSLISL